MSHYAAGTRFEHRIRDDLRENGYDVIRAAGSKGASKVDLVALKPGQLLFIQAKRSGALPPAEWDRVYEVAGWVGAIPLLAANGPRGRGVVYTELLGPKVPRARVQPCRPFLLDEIAAAPVQATTELPTGTAHTLAWMRRHGLGHGAGVAAVLSAVRADLARPVVDEHGNRPDSCGYCELLPTVNGWVRATQVGCPAHGGEPAPVVVPYQPAAARVDGVDDIPLPGMEVA